MMISQKISKSDEHIKDAIKKVFLACLRLNPPPRV